MKISHKFGLLCCLVTFVPLTAIPTLTINCTPAQQKEIKAVTSATAAVLSDAQIACVFASALTDAPALAKACSIVDNADKLLPLITQLVGQREGAKKAGVTWRTVTTTSDAGIMSDASLVDAR